MRPPVGRRRECSRAESGSQRWSQLLRSNKRYILHWCIRRPCRLPGPSSIRRASSLRITWPSHPGHHRHSHANPSSLARVPQRHDLTCSRLVNLAARLTREIPTLARGRHGRAGPSRTSRRLHIHDVHLLVIWARRISARRLALASTAPSRLVFDSGLRLRRPRISRGAGSDHNFVKPLRRVSTARTAIVDAVVSLALTVAQPATRRLCQRYILHIG